MAARSRDLFTTIHTEGALLPPDLLQRIVEGDGDLDGLTPASYHLSGERLNEATNRAWNRLQGAWAAFKAARERLPAGDLGTTSTRERWLLPLFSALDYGRLQTARAVEIDGKSYPISHVWGNVPIHLVSYQLDLDRRTPGVAGAATASPYSLLQVYLNRSDDVLWGFLSNGLRMRILRDNVSLTRQAFVEFDLEAMMEGEVYADFVMLYLLCHQSRVETERPSDFWLEHWMQAAQKQGTRALDTLRDGVARAIECLGSGFIAHPANHDLREKLRAGGLDTQDYYRELLRLVYRLLFLFTAEDRDLLLSPTADEDARQRYVDYYSTRRLRAVAERIKGTRHRDLFDGLRLVMRLLSDEAPDPSWFPPLPEGEPVPLLLAGGPGVRASILGLPPLGGWLFRESSLADVIGCQISNRELLDAVRALAYTADRATRTLRPVDYKNLGPEELGSVYESLLELHPHINIDARSFALETAAGHERKTTGSYYTPDSLVQALLDSALDPVIEEAIKGPGKAPTPGPSPSGGGESVREMASKAMVQAARELRQRQTLAEQILWEALRKNRLRGLGFRRQHPVANTHYVVDFFCYQANLIVELDGEVHQFQQKEDAQRQTDLESLGYRILRFANERITNDLENVLIRILNVAQEQVPPHEGEGFRVGATAEERLLSLNICDPACGSGHFLIAAARRVARALASLRTGEEEPPPADLRTAVRDVIGRCVYGVDINPMAVELCKVNLWMEALEPGKPLSFLDANIQCGNSLIGATPALLRKGIPDDAFKPIKGDDKAVCREYRKRNKKGREGQLSMFDAALQPWERLGDVAAGMMSLDAVPDDTIEGVRRKQKMYQALVRSSDYEYGRLWADAWCAAFVWKKSKEFPYPITEEVFRQIERNPHNIAPWMRDEIRRLAGQYGFFHWHLAFPNVFRLPGQGEEPENEQTGWNGGFDVVLGNPPWDQVELSEKEFFAGRSPEIAEAATARQRRKMIENLQDVNPHLSTEFADTKRQIYSYRHFVQSSGRYPYSSAGRINLYPLFAEAFALMISSGGQAGLIVPSNISMDAYNVPLFRWLIETKRLVSLFDFENRNGLFPAVHRMFRFCILTLGGPGLASRKKLVLGYFFQEASDCQDKDRRIEIEADEIRLFSPNTLSPPILISRRDADIARRTYHVSGILVDHYEQANPWQIAIQRMLSLSDTGDIFRSFEEMEVDTCEPPTSWKRMYAGKVIHAFNHRYATYEYGDWRETSLEELQDPLFEVTTQYYARHAEVMKRLQDKPSHKWLVAYREITNATNETTMIASFLPSVATDTTFRNLYSPLPPTQLTCLVGNLNAFCFDFFARQKVIGTHLSATVLEQLPALSPHTYSSNLLDFTVPRILELTYTAWDLQPFARDCGYNGPPFRWDEERRFLLRCELDALYFHLYQIARDDVDYIMESFPIVKRKDEKKHGEYRTKRVILEMYDQMAALPRVAVPHPKGLDEPYLVPDVSQFETWLSPHPADPSVAHPGRDQ